MDYAIDIRIEALQGLAQHQKIRVVNPGVYEELRRLCPSLPLCVGGFIEIRFQNQMWKELKNACGGYPWDTRGDGKDFFRFAFGGKVWGELSCGK